MFIKSVMQSEASKSQNKRMEKKLAKLKWVSTSVGRQSHLSVTISRTAPKVDTEQGEI